MAYDFNSLTKQADEANNRDKFYTDFSDVDPNKLHQISELTDWMRTKAKGSDVREVIAQLFERTWLENIKEGNANMEVSQARGAYPNLRSRLDEVDNKQRQTTTQLAQKANKDEVTNVITPKGTLAYASLPTSGNEVGWYYYCPDGDGTHGAGNYVWNGKSWYFGGTGDEGYNLLKEDLGTISNDSIIFNDWELGTIAPDGSNQDGISTRIRTSGYHKICNKYFYAKVSDYRIGYSVYDESGKKLFGGGWLERGAEFKFKNRSNWRWRFIIDTGDLDVGNSFVVSTEPTKQELTFEMGGIIANDDGTYSLTDAPDRVRSTGFYKCEKDSFVTFESNVRMGVNKLLLSYENNSPVYKIVYGDGWYPANTKISFRNDTECFYKLIFEASRISDVRCKAVTSKTQPVTTVASNIVEKTFKRTYANRNFLETKKRIGGIDLKSNIFLKDSNMHPITNLTSPGLNVMQVEKTLKFSNNEAGKQESKMWIGSVYPAFLCSFNVDELNFSSNTSRVVLDVGDVANGNHIYIGLDNWTGSSIDIIVDTCVNNGTVGDRLTISNVAVLPNFTMICHFVGSKISFLVKNQEQNIKYVGSVDVTDRLDIRNISIREKMSIFLGVLCRAQNESATLSNIVVEMTGGTGQADPRIIHYEDGTPIIKDGKIFLAMTTRGYNLIPYSCQGVYSMDLTSKELEICAMLSYDNGDGISRFWHASDILYNRITQEWCVFPVSHGDDHGIYFATTKNDILHGYHDIKIENKLKYPSVGNEEDPYIIRKDNVWYMLYVKGTSGYNLCLAKSIQLRGVFTDIASVSETSFTGPIIYVTGDTLYCIAGKGIDHFKAYTFPDLTYVSDLTLDLPLFSNNVWPVIFDCGSHTKLLTFDRGKLTGNYSYGAIYEYELN